MNTIIRAALSLVFAFSSLLATPGAPLQFSGKVVDGEGHPVAGSTVTRYEPREGIGAGREFEAKEQVTSLEDGSFALNLPRTPSVFVATKPGYAPSWRHIWNVRGVLTNEQLVVGVPAVLAGVVIDETERPVPGAEVYVSAAITETPQPGGGRSYNYLTGKLARNLFHSKAGADGRFRIEGFPAGVGVDLYAQSKGKALRDAARESLGPDTMPWRGGDREIKLILDPAGSIQGTVVEQESGRPLAGAGLMLQPQQGGFFGAAVDEPVRAGADGAFEIVDVPAGAYRARAVFEPQDAPEWVAEAVPATVETGQAARGVRINAVRGGFLQARTIAKASQQPVPEASVSAYRDGSQASAKSDANGIALLRLFPGDYYINAYRERDRAENQTATITAGETNRIEFELSPPPKLNGVVRRPDGQPAAAAEVRIAGAGPVGGVEQPTSAEGRFELEWEPRGFGGMDSTPCLLVRMPEAGWAAAQEIEEGSGPLELRLEPGLTFVGEVTSVDGRPLTNFTASLLFWTGRSGMYLQGLDRRTDAPGRFEIPAIPAGRRYGISVSAPGHGQVTRSQISYDASEVKVDLGRFELNVANLKLSGSVLDSDDKPVAGASVNIHGDGQPNDSVRTDKQGKFTFTRVCTGLAQLFANARDAFGNATAQGGESNVVIRLRPQDSRVMASAPPRLYKGTIRGPDGQPAPRARVRLLSAFNFDGQWTRADNNGVYRLSSERQPRQAGSAWLAAQDADGKLAAAVEVTENSTNVDLQISPGGVLAGRIQGHEGKPLALAEVTLMSTLSRMETLWNDRPLRSEANGQFEFGGLPTNLSYRIYASAPGYGRSQQEARFEGAAGLRLDLAPMQLKPANLPLAGRVVADDEKPVPNVQVQTSGADQPQTFTSTDREGRFKMQVCEGPVRLFAHAGDLFGSITVEGGETNALITLGSRARSVREAPPRRSLEGGPVPDLVAVGLDAAALPAGRPGLICLVDWDQRLSRRALRLLDEKAAALRQRGAALAIVQTTSASDDSFQDLKSGISAEGVAIGRVSAKTPATRWATEATPLPWLILVDRQGRVAAEGFTLDDLEAKLEALDVKQGRSDGGEGD